MEIKFRGYERSVLVMDGSTPVAEVFTKKEPGDQYQTAVLFAAAPDLLEALKELLHMPEFDGTPECSLLRRDAKRAARAAIAKAEGAPA